MDIGEALALLEAAPSYAPVSQLGVPLAVLEELSSHPEYGRLVVDGCRKRLTRTEVDKRLPRYLEELKHQLRASIEVGGEPVNRQKIAESVGLSYSVLRTRTQKNHDDYLPWFADTERAIYEEIVRTTEDRYLWMINQPMKELDRLGWSVKQMNPVIQLLRLRHPDYSDRRKVEVSGQIGHMLLHGMLAEELAEISGRFERPGVKELSA